MYDCCDSQYQPLMISTFRIDLTSYNQDILRLKVTKVLRILLKKFCEYHTWRESANSGLGHSWFMSMVVLITGFLFCSNFET